MVLIAIIKVIPRSIRCPLVLTLVETVTESCVTMHVNFGRVRFPVFVDHLNLCTHLILLVDGLNIVVTNLKEDHGRWLPLSV